ncbi:MAG: zinc ribbon domain-containing protein [Candidatus Helarchaeota archaeon]
MDSNKFKCIKCGERISIIKALIKGYILVIEGKCPKRHTNKFYLQLKNRDYWLDDFRISINQCICGEEVQLEQVLPRGAYVVLMMRCPNHGVVKKFVASPIWSDLENLPIIHQKKIIPDTPYEQQTPEIIVPPTKMPENEGDSSWNTDIAGDGNITEGRDGEIRFCPSCGEEVIPGSFFCTNCGEELK